MRPKIIWYFCLLFTTSADNSRGVKEGKTAFIKSTVILVSFDGFRWDYMDKVETPHLDFIVKTGVKAKYITNAFVTKTFPNHFTIVTGLYEESHGIVANTMYDQEFKAWFYLNNTETRWWNGGEPVWVTNQRSGGTSGIVFWPGSEVKIRGQYPTHFLNYDHNLPYKNRVDRLIRLLTMTEPPNFLAAYFDEPDHSGHRYGPDSKEVEDAIRKVDGVAGDLIEQLKQRNLLDKVNLIITSDHGMTEISEDKTIYLEDYIPPNSYSLISFSPCDVFAQILPKDGQEDRLLHLLRDVRHLNVYRKDDIPDEYHYKRNRRIMPIFVVGDEGWSVLKNRQVKFTNKGNHGYSNRYMSMSPFFVARGPYFREGYISEPFRNVDIYPMMCEILGIKPASNNGSLDRVKDIFRATTHAPAQDYAVLSVILISSSLVLILMSYGIVSFCVNYRCRMREYGHIYNLGTDFDL